jgi:hypothetical protein
MVVIERRKGKRNETGRRKKDRRRLRKEKVKYEHNKWRANLMQKSDANVKVEQK